jgi:hypothetical protein
VIGISIYFKIYPISSKNERILSRGFEVPAAHISQRHWDYAQKIGPTLIIKYQCVSLLLIALLCITNLSNTLLVKISFALSMLFFLMAMLFLEIKTKKIK